MNRKYTREEYLQRIADIKRIIPGCGITTDIFVGYHDETEEDHQETLSLVKEVASTAPSCSSIQSAGHLRSQASARQRF